MGGRVGRRGAAWGSRRVGIPVPISDYAAGFLHHIERVGNRGLFGVSDVWSSKCALLPKSVEKDTVFAREFHVEGNLFLHRLPQSRNSHIISRGVVIGYLLS